MADEPTPYRRRTILGGAAAFGVGVPLLAACGSDDGGSEDSKAEAPSTGTVLTPAADVAVGSGVILDQEKVVVTQPEEGTYKAFSSICTHQKCPVTEITETIDCSCHGSKFSLTDGSVQAGPAPSPLSEVKVKLDGDNIVTA